MVTEKFDEFVIFRQKFWQKCAIELKFLVKHSPTLGTLVSTKTKCIKLIFIGKITLIPVAFLIALSISFFQRHREKSYLNIMKKCKKKKKK